MNKHLKLILATFAMQKHQHDCGIACLESILNYAGIRLEMPDRDNGEAISLFRLHTLAGKAGIDNACVIMEEGTLQTNPCPCILHIINDAGLPHFVVHYFYDAGSGLHLIGDPDDKLELVSGPALLKKWQSRAALYLENVNPKPGWKTRIFPWYGFLTFNFIPKILWIAVPMLNILAGILGLAVTLIIQKALEPGFMNSNNHFFMVVFLLLILVSLAKCSVNYLRQVIIIRFSAKLDKILFERFIQNLRSPFKSIYFKFKLYTNVASDVQRVHQAVALLIGIACSDGLVVMVMLGCLYFYCPVLIWAEAATFMAMILVIDRFMPVMLIGSHNTAVPSMGIQQAPETAQAGDFDQIFEKSLFDMNEGLSEKVRMLSANANRINLYFESINTGNILFVLILSMGKLHDRQISYESFLLTIILCYGISAFMTKICNQLFTIAQGAEIMRKHG